MLVIRLMTEAINVWWIYGILGNHFAVLVLLVNELPNLHLIYSKTANLNRALLPENGY